MPITYFPLNVDVSQVVGTPVRRALLEVRTNLPDGTVLAYGESGQIAVPGGVYDLASGIGSLTLPTKAGLTNVGDYQYVITGVYHLDGVHPVKMDPIYIDAPTSTAAVNLADFIGVTSAPPTFMGQAVAQLQAKVDEAEAIKAYVTDVSNIDTTVSAVDFALGQPGPAATLNAAIGSAVDPLEADIAAIPAAIVAGAEAKVEPIRPAGGSRAARADAAPVSVKAHGAVGNNVADDTAAIQAAINAAGEGGTVILPPGRYKTGPLTMLNWQTIIGGPQQFGAGTVVPTELMFSGLTGTQVGITCGASSTIKDVRLQGPGATVGTGTQGVTGIFSNTTTIRLDGVTLYRWKTGVHLFENWYTVIHDTEFRYNGTGLFVDYCYNLNLDGTTRFNCAIDGSTTTYGVGIRCANSCMFTLHGCAIENYSTGVLLSANSSASFFGTYFESSHTGNVGISGQTIAGTTINAYGCQVYLLNSQSWINVSAATDGALNSRGNRFICTNSTTADPTAYYWGFTPALDINVGGDSWKGVTFAGAAYHRNNAHTERVTIEPPTGATGGAQVRPDRYSFGRNVSVAPNKVVQTGRGTTAERPVAATAGAGAEWYDTTLGKPIWSNGTAWRDATGASV